MKGFQLKMKEGILIESKRNLIENERILIENERILFENARILAEKCGARSPATDGETKNQ